MAGHSCVRLMTTNYIDLDLLTFTDVSSEQVAFPVTNAYNAQRRSKVWRSNGYFKVTSLNNVIIFNEGGGDLTATIAVGEYTSASALATAVDTALTTAPGASGSYTVTYSSFFKFNLSKSAGTFNIKWTNVLTTAADLLGYSDAMDDTGLLTYDADFIRIHTEEFVLWDFGIETNPMAFMFIGPRNRPIRISPSATIYLQGNETNNFEDPSYNTQITYDDEVMSLLSDTGLHTDALRYWRLLIIDKENTNGFVEVGAFFLGDYFDPDRGRVQFPLESSFVDRSTTVFSEGGQTYSDVREQTQQFRIAWFALQKQDIEELKEIFFDYGTSFPFFVVFDATGGFSTNVNRMIRYCKFETPPSFSLERSNLFRAQMSLREEL